MQELDRPRSALVVANPAATRVTPEFAQAVVDALSTRLDARCAYTEGRWHAADLAREGANSGTELIVALGGDGTVNEIASALAHSDLPLACLPGGLTSVFARVLGMPYDRGEATRRLVQLVDTPRWGAADLGVMNGRHFVFSSGAGLSGAVVEQVERRPRVKSRLKEYYFVSAALRAGRRYVSDPPTLDLDVEGDSVLGASVVVQNTEVFTYFGQRPIHLGEGAGLGTGSLAMVMLHRVDSRVLLTLPRLMLRGGGPAVLGMPEITSLPGVREGVVTPADGRPVPVELDGEFAGRFVSVRYATAPAALRVLAPAVPRPRRLAERSATTQAELAPVG